VGSTRPKWQATSAPSSQVPKKMRRAEAEPLSLIDEIIA
jgi:hypothetical protein